MQDPASVLVLVTGATDGIGRETAHALARRGARVVVHGRDAARARRVAQEIHSAEEPLLADLSSMGQVRRMADAFKARGQPLDVLIHNAGIYANTRSVTEDGFELTMAVNHFAPFLLTHLLLDALRAAPQGRIINVSSIAHRRGHIDLDDLELAAGWDPYGAYATSKLANVLFTEELALRLQGSAVTVNALHPGVVSTKLLKQGFGMEGPDSLAEGAATSVFLALDPSVARTTGGYFMRSRQSQRMGDAALARAFYLKSCARVGVTPLPSSSVV